MPDIIASITSPPLLALRNLQEVWNYPLSPRNYTFLPRKTNNFALKKVCRKQILVVKSELDFGRPKTRRTIFHELLDPDLAKERTIPSVEDIKDEAYTVMLAAADTTGNTLCTIARHLTLNRDIYQKLVAELKVTYPDPDAKMDFLTLEKLPYLVRYWSGGIRYVEPITDP